MFLRPIARSEDLARLRAEGYTLRIAGGKLVVDDVPFADNGRSVRRGSLVMPLTLAGETTVAPQDHTASFVGGIPCDATGTPLNSIINNTNASDLGDGLVASCYFSAKPVGSGRYENYYEKVTTYVGHISSPAAAIDVTATAKVHRPVPATEEDEGPFKYIDTASSRAGIEAITEKLKPERLAIVGLGGSGEYILDFTAKTRAGDIHLFDGDRFYSHNAFRGPGAPSLAQLGAAPFKVDYFAQLYSNMRTGIVAHPFHIDGANCDELRGMTFVFIAVDHAPSKKPIIAGLEERRIPFVDVGMGLHAVDGRLTGVVRATASTSAQRAHVYEGARISFSDADVDNDYSTNIQIAELNALNAALAVIWWKKHRGVYADLEHEHHMTYSIDGNHLLNEDHG